MWKTGEKKLKLTEVYKPVGLIRRGSPINRNKEFRTKS